MYFLFFWLYFLIKNSRAFCFAALLLFLLLWAGVFLILIYLLIRLHFTFSHAFSLYVAALFFSFRSPSLSFFLTDATRVVQFAAGDVDGGCCATAAPANRNETDQKTRIVNAKKRKRDNLTRILRITLVCLLRSRSNEPSALARPPRSALLLHLLTVARDDDC